MAELELRFEGGDPIALELAIRGLPQSWRWYLEHERVVARALELRRPLELGEAGALPYAGGGPVFAGGGPRSAPLVRHRYLCAWCPGELEVVATCQTFAWLEACRRGWLIRFEDGEAVRICRGLTCGWWRWR